MTTRQKLIAKIEEEIKLVNERLDYVKQVPGLDEIELDAVFWSNQIDFNELNHDDVIKVIKHIGGKWDKTPSDGGTINYETKVGDRKIRCWNGQPPPNCKIVEVIEEVPAQPARMVTRKKLVCQ